MKTVKQYLQTSLLTTSLIFATSSISAQTIYVDDSNITGVEDGTKQHPFKTVEEGINASSASDTIFIKNGDYYPPDNRIYIKPGNILIGEEKESAIIHGDIYDTVTTNLPVEIHNLTFTDFIFGHSLSVNLDYTQPGKITGNICNNIYIAHRGGVIENGEDWIEDWIFMPIPFFYIENNEVAEEISFKHGAGQIVGKNIVRNNKAGIIALKHGAISSLNEEPKPEYAYLIEKNTVSEGIECKQGGSPNFQYPDSVVKDYTIIKMLNNRADFIELKSGAGYTYLIDNNKLVSGITDSSGGNWTTISNNTISNGQIVDKSGGTSYLENQIIEGNTIYFESNGDPDEDYAIIEKGASATISNNKIECIGAASGIDMKSGYPSNIIGNEINVGQDAEYGINTSSGAGVVTGNKIKGGKVGYRSSSGATLFSGNEISNAYYGFLSSGNEEVRNNLITNCVYGMVLNGLHGPVSENTITVNDSIGIWVLHNADIGGGEFNGIGRNIIRGNGYYDMRISFNPETDDTLFIKNNAWDHETLEDILKYDILNESNSGKLTVDISSYIILPDTPVLLTPENAVMETDTIVNLSWQKPAGAEFYQIQVAEDENFNSLVYNADSVDVLQISLENLKYKTTYYWRCKSANLAGESNWSETWSFQTKTATGIDDLEKSIVEFLNVYPNPFSENVTISYSLAIPEVVSLKLYNVLGKEIVNLVNQFQPQGNYKIQFNGNRLKPGVYFCRLTTGKSSQTIKLMLSEY